MDVDNKSHNSTKTDLAFLLECLKFQMKCPDSQKQALQTIFTICQKREEHVDLFREMGGVEFVYNLSKSSIVNSDVQETALFMLGTLAETNLFCKHFLCRSETFSDLSALLLKDDDLLTQKRVAVYVLSVLIANNKSGQVFAQTTGCLNILLDLFRTSFPLSREASHEPVNAAHIHLLWTSVSTTLCGCVNNPQNEEAQRACMAAFPMVKTWLQNKAIHRTELFQRICSFIAMTVANNSCAQESFFASGGLQTLTLTLVCLASDAEKSPLSSRLSVIITNTLSACITDNSTLATGLAKYGVVPQLLSLLSSPSLEPQDMLSVILTLGQLTETSEEHQSQLVNYGGLSTVITLVTEAPFEELRKAAACILNSYKKATMPLEQGRGLTQSEKELVGPTNMGTYQRSAREMLLRISELEGKKAKKAGDMQCEGSPPPEETLRRMKKEPNLHRGETAHYWLGGGDRNEHGGEEHSKNFREFTPPCCFEPPIYVDKSQVRRKIFQTNNETQKSAPKGGVEEKMRISRLSTQNGDRERTAHTETRDNGDFNLQDVLRALREKTDRDRELQERLSHLSTLTEPVENVQDNYRFPKKLIKCNTRIPSVLPTRVQAGQAEGVCSRCRASVVLVSTPVIPPENAREPPSGRKVPVKHRVPKYNKWMDDEDALLLCSDLLDSEIRRTVPSPVTIRTPLQYRCTGCVLRFEEVTSRTFPTLQSSCQYSCDMHTRLQEATDRYRAGLLNKQGEHKVTNIEGHSEKAAATVPCRLTGDDDWREVRMTPIRGGESPLFQRERHGGITLIPRCRRDLMSRDKSAEGEEGLHA